MISYFLLNPESETLIAGGLSTQRLVYEAGPGCRADNPDRLESAVGHGEKEVHDLIRSVGMKTKIFYGSWCGREQYVTYQDMVCIQK